MPESETRAEDLEWVRESYGTEVRDTCEALLAKDHKLAGECDIAALAWVVHCNLPSQRELAFNPVSNSRPPIPRKKRPFWGRFFDRP
jgi:hypothetical protein